MRKKTENTLDIEAMRIGYKGLLQEACEQLNAGLHSDGIRALLLDRKQHIESRLEDLKCTQPR
jgi:hypothetical protein